MSFLDAASAILLASWRMMVQINFPGTSVSFAAIGVGALCAVVSLRVIGYVIGVNYNIAMPSHAIGKLKVAGENKRRQQNMVARKSGD